MAVPATTQPKPTAVIEIERLGFDWNEVADFDITRLDIDNRRVQVREVDHYAPKEMVEQYAIQMGETAFPPIVVSSDDWLVDGNTRVAARQKRGDKFCSAIVLDVAYVGASPKQRNLLHALAATLNQTGALRLTQKETREVAARLLELNWKPEQIGRAIGLKSSAVTQVKQEIAAAEKMRKVGLNPNGSKRGPSLRALGKKPVIELNDEPYKELASLAIDADLTSSEIATLGKQARETGSDEGAVSVITDQRTEFGDRIRDVQLTGSGKPPVSRRLRQHLGFVTKFEGQEDQLLETDPEVSATHVQALRTSIAVLSEVLRMQER